MVNQSAEEAFRRGKLALASGRGREAMALFEASIELERRAGRAELQPRYMSFYGLCLVFEARRHREGLAFCREAVSRCEYDPDVYWNYGRVLMCAGRRAEAFTMFRQGLTLNAQHRGIRRELKRMGVRRAPVLPFLSRNNRLNILLGRLMHKHKDDARRNARQRGRSA